MAAGDFAARVEVGRRDEIGKLSEALNQMGNELERRFHQVEGTRSIAASALASIPSADAVASAFVLQAAPLAGDAEVVVALADGCGRDPGGPISTSQRRRQAAGGQIEDLSRGCVGARSLRGPATGWVRGRGGLRVAHL